MPPKSRNSTLVAFEAEASRVVDPDKVAPFEGMSTLVVGGGEVFVSIMPPNSPFRPLAMHVVVVVVVVTQETPFSSVTPLGTV
jgi:hypothetical protein